MGSSSPNRQLIYDAIRRRWVKATPEEIVRQTWVCRMVQQLGFPKELIAVERSLDSMSPREGIKIPSRRVDIVAFTKSQGGMGLAPLVLIECKIEPLDEGAVAQVMGYNYFVKSPFIAVVNAEEVLLGSFDPKQNQYLFERKLLSYVELLNQVNR